MAIIYVVTRGNYSDYQVVAVFDESRKYTAARLAEQIKGDFEEFELNPETIFPKMTRFEVLMSMDGEKSKSRVCDEDFDENINLEDLSKILPTYWNINTYKPYNITVWCFANDKRHATKIANEYRTRLMALGIFDIAMNDTLGRNFIDRRDIEDYVRAELSEINEE